MEWFSRTLRGVDRVPPAERELDSGLPLERARARLLVLLLSVLLQTLTLGNRWGAPDEMERVQAAQRFLEDGSIRLPNGRHTKYPPGTVLMLVPGVALKHLVPGNHDALLMVPEMLASSLCVLPFQRALWAVGVPLGPSVVASAIFAVINPTWPYGKRLYSEPFTALFVLCALAAGLAWRARGRRRSLIWMWLSMAGAASNNSVALVLLPVLAGLVTFKPQSTWRRPHVDRLALISSAVASVAIVGAWMLSNQLRFGHPLSSGYQDTAIPNDVFDGQVGFSTPVWIGLYGLLFSAGRGLLFYCPLSLLGLWALLKVGYRWRGAWPWMVAAGAVPLLVYSAWWSWHGGTCYGPRLMTPFMGAWLLGIGPLLVEMRAGRLRSILLRLTLAGFTFASVLAAAVGTLFMFSYDQQFWLRGQPFNDHLDVYTPQFSALPRSLQNAVMFPDDINWMWLRAEPREPLTVSLHGQHARVVEVQLKGQALRDNWEVAEIEGVTADGTKVHPVSAQAREGHRPESMNDGDVNTAWLGGTQKTGQWIRVDFGEQAPPLKSVTFIHARQGAAYPKFPAVRWGPSAQQLGPWKDVATTRGDLHLRWPAWLCLLGVVVVMRGVRRMAGMPVERARPA